MKKKALIIIKIDLKFEIQTIHTTLYYIKIKIKFNNITHQIKFKNKVEIKRQNLKILIKKIV